MKRLLTIAALIFATQTSITLAEGNSEEYFTEKEIFEAELRLARARAS